MEDEFAAREKKILSILEQEIMDGEEVAAAVRRLALRLLLDEKDFSPAEVRQDVHYTVELGEEKIESRIDLVVSADGKDAMIVKCAPGSLDSRQRQAIAAARVFGNIPVAVVMDPQTAQVLDAHTGKVIGEGYEAIPKRGELARILASAGRAPALPPGRLEKEKRILLAFDAIQCCIPRGADGKGVSLDSGGDCSCS
jgi:ABC-type glutathione transport system ATPase component